MIAYRTHAFGYRPGHTPVGERFDLGDQTWYVVAEPSRGANWPHVHLPEGVDQELLQGYLALLADAELPTRLPSTILGTLKCALCAEEAMDWDRCEKCRQPLRASHMCTACGYVHDAS